MLHDMIGVTERRRAEQQRSGDAERGDRDRER